MNTQALTERERLCERKDCGKFCHGPDGWRCYGSRSGDECGFKNPEDHDFCPLCNGKCEYTLSGCNDEYMILHENKELSARCPMEEQSLGKHNLTWDFLMGLRAIQSRTPDAGVIISTIDYIMDECLKRYGVVENPCNLETIGFRNRMHKMLLNACAIQSRAGVDKMSMSVCDKCGYSRWFNPKEPT